MARRDWYCEDVLSGRVDVERVHEDNLVLAFHHPRPVAEVHVVVVPKAHVAGLMAEAALDGAPALFDDAGHTEDGDFPWAPGWSWILRQDECSVARRDTPYALACYRPGSRCRLAGIGNTRRMIRPAALLKATNCCTP